MPRTPLSHSRLETWEACPLKFQALYLDKPPAVTRKALHLYIGRFFHDWAQIYIQHLIDTQQASDVATAESLFESAWMLRHENKEVASLPETSHGGLYKMVMGFVDTHLFDPDKVVETEAEIALTEQWKPTTWMAPDVFFRAKIDLTLIVPPDQPDGQSLIGIWDFKTGYNVWSKSETEESPQLRRYVMAQGATMVDQEEYAVTLDFVRPNIQRTVRMSREIGLAERARTLAISDRIEEAKKKRAFPATPGTGCGDCPLFGTPRCTVVPTAIDRGLQDEAAATAALAELLLLDRRRKDLLDLLKPYTDKAGPVVSGGMVYGPGPKSSDVYDVPAFFEWAEKWGIDPKLLVRVLSKDELRKALARAKITKDALAALEAIRTEESWTEDRVRKLRADEA